MKNDQDKRVVGAEGFEPPTSCSQSRRATRLRYAPNFLRYTIYMIKIKPYTQTALIISWSPMKKPGKMVYSHYIERVLN